MDEALRTRLLSAGWKSGTFRGFLMSRRASIEFQVGPARASRSDAEEGAAPRLELRYKYVTDGTRAEGEEVLPDGAGLREIEDAMTGIYLRVHERPDVTKVFGARRRSGGGGGGVTGAPAPQPVTGAPPSEPGAEPGQGTLDL